MSFQGSLNELPLADIVQLVAVSGKTGMFSMTRASEKGYVYLQNGQITHAKVGDVEGDDAIYALALWNQGTFQFSPGVESRRLQLWCKNCGSTRTIEEIHAMKALSCCPERDMVTLDNMLTAHARDSYVGPRKIVVALGDLVEGAEIDRLNSAKAQEQ